MPAMTGRSADIINDISGGDLDPEMAATVARLNVPYILMHMRGTPSTMSTLTEYNDVTADVLAEIAEKINHWLQCLRQACRALLKAIHRRPKDVKSKPRHLSIRLRRLSFPRHAGNGTTAVESRAGMNCHLASQPKYRTPIPVKSKNMTGRSYIISLPCRLIENGLNSLTLKDSLKLY